MNPSRVTVEEVREALDYDPKTGVLRWRHRPFQRRQWNTRYAGTVAGSVAKTGYRFIQISKGRHFGAHLLAWIYHYGIVPTVEIDHRNGRRDENWIDNLREARDGANSINKAMQRNNTSGYVGVAFHPQTGMWRVRVTKNRVHHSPGRLYDTAEEAAEARKKLAAEIHGEFDATSGHDRGRFFHQRDSHR